MHKLNKLLIWFVLIPLVILGSLSAFSLLNYQASVLDYPLSYEELNSYWSDHLNVIMLPFELRAHFWEEGLIILADDGMVFEFDPKGDGVLVELHPLPDSYQGPARSLGFNHFADKGSVYYFKDGGWLKVLDDYYVWHRGITALGSDHLVIGEYGNRIALFCLEEMDTRIIHSIPEDTTHFHFTAADPYTDHIFTALGDAHLDKITGIQRSKDLGETWEWVHYTRMGLQDTHRQPTAVCFAEDRILFGTDSPPHGIFSFERGTEELTQLFVMPNILKSYFMDIVSHDGIYWAVSRSFAQTPQFGVLWTSVCGDKWYPVQVMEGLPHWIGIDRSNGYVSVGFESGNSGFLLACPGAEEMRLLVEGAPGLSLSWYREATVNLSRWWVDSFKSLVRLVLRVGI